MVTAALPHLEPGSVVGSYRVEKAIGRGGMGQVFLASHCVLPRQAAIKIMHSELSNQPGLATRMVQEASILENIRHPGLVRVYECNVLADHRPYIVMEYVPGETLTERLERARVMAWREVAALLGSVADVLAAVHLRGVVHRDLKPDNLILTPTDPDFPLRVIDWGVARLGAVGRLTMEGMTPGTPIYMSPEQAAGQHIAAPCDMYSLGVIAYEMLCGEPPFDGTTLTEVVCKHLASLPKPLTERCNAPAELCELVHRMLDKDPSRRPMAVDVRRLCTVMVQSPAESVDSSFDDNDLEITIVPSAEEPAAAAELEYVVTELLPTMRKPRWTPQFAVAAVPPSRKLITPKGERDQVSGEIVKDDVDWA